MTRTIVGVIVSMLCLSLIISHVDPRKAIAAGEETAVSSSLTASADEGDVYTGTIVTMNGRMRSTGFTLKLSGFTSDDDFNRYLTTLIEGNQDDVLKQIRGNKFGYMAATGQTGRQVLVARKTPLSDGKTRIAVAFERWMRFGEVRNGYRSEDYPFGILEMIVDDKGKGGGTFISAGAVDMKRDKKTGQYRLELENFGTFPSKVMGVMRRK
jgi:hypothetical protein